eukprot:9892035-Ditylum_brightwellii.AAC.1
MNHACKEATMHREEAAAKAVTEGDEKIFLYENKDTKVGKILQIGQGKRRENMQKRISSLKQSNKS